jgi:hypothetical protein
VIGHDGRIADALGFVSDDDAAAIEKAKRLVNGHDIELWQLDRKVATFQHKE